MSQLVKWQEGRVVNGAIPQAVGKLKYDDRLPTFGGQLWPRQFAENALAEAEAALKPAGIEIGLKQARTLLSAFPNKDNSDPEVYVRAIASALASCPAAIGKQVVNDVVLGHKFGLPPVAVVAEKAKELMQPIVNVKWAAQGQLREHARRDANRPKPSVSNFSDEEKIQMLDYLSPELRAFIASGESEDVQKAAKQMIAGAVKRPPKPEKHTNGIWTDSGWAGHSEPKAAGVA
jgi:hypothetical protein